MHFVPSLSDSDALLAVETIRTALVNRKCSGVIAVADAHGELITLHRMSGAPLSSIAVATNKAFSAARLRRATREIGQRSRHPENGFDISYYGDPRYVGWGGGLPVMLQGEVAGAVAVSGLTDLEDEELAALGIAAVLAHVAVGTASVATKD